MFETVTQVARLLRVPGAFGGETCMVCGGPVRSGEQRYRLHGGSVHLACASYRVRNSARIESLQPVGPALGRE